MEKLNELAEQAKEISYKNWFINSDEEVTAIDKDAGPDDSEEVFIGCAANIQLAKYITSASPETILAIAEAFRALEQRALAAEAKLAESATPHHYACQTDSPRGPDYWTQCRKDYPGATAFYAAPAAVIPMRGNDHE